MEIISKELRTVKWSRKCYIPSELAEKKKSFPIVVKIANSVLSDRFYEDYSRGQVLYLHSVKEQLRFLAYDKKGNEFSIPINSEINFVNRDIQEESSVLLHEDLKLPLRVKVNSNQHARLPDLMSPKTSLEIKQKGLMKYLIGTCISEDAEQFIECIPTECSSLSLQVPLMIGDGCLTLFEEHVQDVVHSVIEESTFNSYHGNPDIIINAQQNLLKIEDSTNEPHDDNKASTMVTNRAKVKKTSFRSKRKGKRHVKKCSANIDKSCNIIGESSQCLKYDNNHSYEMKIYRQDQKKHTRTKNKERTIDDADYEEVGEGSYNDYYEEIIDIPSEETAHDRGNEVLEQPNGDKDVHDDKIDKPTSLMHQILPKLPPRNTPEEHRIRTNEDLPDNLSDMTCNQVQDCLKLLKLDKHVKDFQEVGIDGELLMSLDEHIMKTELNLTKFEIVKLELFMKNKWLPQV
ncbi:uncharacterized protein [Antedon mediterranea]